MCGCALLGLKVVSDTLAYRLSIDPLLEAFRSEIEHVATIMDRYYGITRNHNADRILHYGSTPPDGAVHVPNWVFPNCVIIGKDGISLDRKNFCRASNDIMQMIQQSEPYAPSFSYDAIGIAFILLSRIEERHPQSLDRYNRFLMRDAWSYDCGIPLADMVIDKIAFSLFGERIWSRRPTFSIRLTHDVDTLRSYHRIWEPLRYATGDIVKRHSLSAAVQRLRRGYRISEPFRSFRDLMDLSERHNIKSNFFFMGASTHSMDSPYALNQRVLLKLVADEVAERGHRIGFHPGFTTFDNPQEWNRQHQSLQETIGREVTIGRQHVLRYRADHTPDIWDAAGMVYDYTLAFPEKPGFRGGSCRPHNAYSLVARKTLSLIQVATPIMEFGLMDEKYQNLSPEAALDQCRSVIKRCRHYGGELVILYHTGQPDGPVRRFYKHLLEEIT